MGSVERGAEFVLMHYADPYYDPVKAHEYYLENRQLVGNQPAAAAPMKPIPKPPGVKESKEERAARMAQNKAIAAANRAAAAGRKGTNQRQAEALKYANKQIGEHKKADSAATAAANKARVAALHNNAKETQNRIVQSLHDAIAKIDGAAKLKPTAPKLNEIPKDATPQQRAFLEAQNRKIGARASAQDSAAQKVANTKRAADTKQANADARAQKVKMANDLKAAIAQARSDYHNAMTSLQSRYKQVSIDEKAAIKANVR